MKARAFIAVQGIVALACGFMIFTGTASAYDPGDIQVLGGSNAYCVTEDGMDSDGNVNGCFDGKGLTNGISALQVSPDNKRLFVLGFDSFFSPTVGDSITTYDRNTSGGFVTPDPRINACRSAGSVPDCSSGGSQAGQLNAPNGLAISPDSKQVYVSARRTSSVSVFDYVAIPEDGSGQQGPLARKAAPDGCLRDAAQVGCTDVRGLFLASDVVMSPDGNTVYTAGRHPSGGGIAVFDRASNGVLTQKVGTAACINDNGDSGCADGNRLQPVALAISADGKNLYAASYDPAPGPGDPNGPNSSVTAFDVNLTNGEISQKPGIAGCFTEDGSGGVCTAVPALNVPVDISITPDGESVYVATDLPYFEDAPDVAPLVAFDRDTSTGALTRQGCFAAEGALGCTTTAGIYRGLAVTSTDEAVYVGSQLRNADPITGGAAPSALVVLNRDTSDQSLTQKPVEGCFTPTFFVDCATVKSISPPRSLAISPDGDSLYVGSEGITVFDRNDGIAPDTTINSGPTGNFFSTSANFSFTADKPNVLLECSLDSPVAFTACDSPTTTLYTGLSVGEHTFRVRATDVFGQVEIAPASRTFTVVNETDPPETTITSGPQEGSTTDTSVSFAFTSDEPGTFECRIDSQAFEACTSPRQFTGLALGTHTFEVRAIDTVGNIDPTPASRSFTVIHGDPIPTCETDPSLCPDPPDTKVDATVTAAKVQKVKGKKIVVAVKVKANEALTAKASGSVKKGKRKAAFKTVTKKLAAGSTTTLKLKPAKAGQGRLVAAALLGSKRTVPKIFITLTDGAANKLVKKPKVTIKGAPAKKR